MNEINLLDSKDRFSTMINYKIVTLIFAGLFLTACNPEMGRLPLDSDVECLHKELSSPDHPSFRIAANFCQKMENNVLQPLHLENAPDLQQQAEKAGIAYTS